jgi:hypothetical protein
MNDPFRLAGRIAHWSLFSQSSMRLNAILSGALPPTGIGG